MAYISKVKNREGKVYVYLKESYRVGDKTKTRVIEKFGSYDNLIKENPNAFEELREQAKQGLFNNYENSKLKIEVDMEEQLQTVLKNYGYLLLDKIYSELNISDIVNKKNKDSKNRYNLDKILKLLVFTRILYPGSKNANFKVQNKLLGDWNIEYNHIMRSLTKFNELKEDIQIKMHESISSSIGREAMLVFYDVTNYYFDTDFNDEDIMDDDGNVIHESLRKRGPSKEKKPKPIVQMGLFMDSNGIPISYQLFPGNNTDPTTYLRAIEQVKKQYGIERVVTVADKAMNSAKNVTQTYDNGDGWVFSQKVRGSRGVAKDIQEFALDRKDWTYNDNLTFAMKSKIRKRKLSTGEIIEEKILVTWSEKYAKREGIRRDGALEYASKLTNAELFRMTSKKGGKRYLKQMVKDKKTGEEIELNPFIRLDMNLAEEDAKFDGLSVIVTSEINMEDEEILKNYRELHKIEDCFRVTKTELNARPIYVWTDEHIEAHFLTCFIALASLRILQYRTNNKMSTKRLKNALKEANAIEITQGIYKMMINEDFKELNSIIGIGWNKANVKYEELKKYSNTVCFLHKKN